MSSSNCCFLTCIEVSQEAGRVIWYSSFFKNFPQFVVIHTVKGFNIVNEAEVFLEFPCFFYDPTDVGNLISVSCAFSKPSLYIWKFLVHVLLKPSLRDFEHCLASVWSMCNCLVVCTFFGSAQHSLGLEWKLTISVLWPLLSFPNLLAFLVQHFHRIFVLDLNSSAGIPLPPLALFLVMLPKAHLTLYSKTSSSRWVIISSWLSGSLRFFCIVLLYMLATSS